MIFKYYTFEIVPWGAILDVDCVSSSKKVGKVSSWSTSTNYQTEYGYLGKDGSYFIESKAEPMSMTYNCTSKNGDLIEIQTNLTCTSTKVNGIITNFTIDNTNWYNQPYVTDSVLIQKNIRNTKITLNNTPYNPTSSYYTKFYINNQQVYYSSYEGNNLYYFDSSVVNFNANVKVKYFIIKQIEETITLQQYNSSYGRLYISKTPYTTPISAYNSNNVNIMSYYSGYNTSPSNFYSFKLNSAVIVGDRIKIKYNYIEEIEENYRAEEVEETTLHQGTIPSNHTNLIIEDCKDSNGTYILYERDNNTIFLNNNNYDGQNIIIRYEKTKPYIKLCCNNVKIETAFLNDGNGYSSDFKYLTKDNNYLYPQSGQTGGKAKLLRYITVHWNKRQQQQVYFGITSGGGLSYCGIYGGSNSDNYSRLTYTINNDTTNLSITTPSINSLTVPYYSVEYVCNMSGDSYYHWPSRSVKSTITSPLIYYTIDGYIKKLPIGDYSLEGFPIPKVFSLNKWGENSSFYSVGFYPSYYVNPSDGIQIFTDWYDTCRDFCDGCGQGCSQGSEHGFRTSGGWNVSPWGEVVTGFADPGNICQDYDTTYYVYANTNFPNAIQHSTYPGYYQVTSVSGISCWTNQGSAY